MTDLNPSEYLSTSDLKLANHFTALFNLQSSSRADHPFGRQIPQKPPQNCGNSKDQCSAVPFQCMSPGFANRWRQIILLKFRLENSSQWEGKIDFYVFWGLPRCAVVDAAAEHVCVCVSATAKHFTTHPTPMNTRPYE